MISTGVVDFVVVIVDLIEVRLTFCFVASCLFAIDHLHPLHWT